MVKLLSTRKAMSIKRGRGIDGQRLMMCDIREEAPEEEGFLFGKGEIVEKKEKMDEILSKLSKMKISNPSNSAKSRHELKNKYISI